MEIIKYIVEKMSASPEAFFGGLIIILSVGDVIKSIVEHFSNVIIAIIKIEKNIKEDNKIESDDQIV